MSQYIDLSEPDNIWGLRGLDSLTHYRLRGFDGDTALVFLKSVSGRLYEEAWHGHMVVEQIDGDDYAVFQHRELWLSPDVPASLRYCLRQDPKRPYASVVRLDFLETYLLALIEQMDHGAT
ncbi:hypothetical protein [Ralstonia solanacearum]|uniref:Uncharacterized protein n=1 Tax=Ralstonia solanacearum TaxID=305 RepID=A0AAE3NH89_RALSL|nr:hypothetical protein [Ralstonia solanacearum]MBB6583671.1 hypothetical protein [Ralstonia solanacearum]MDB0521900.1 hypothetical protein [Ralstonia solanacearum]